MDDGITMKPLLAVAIKEALRLALDDSCIEGDTVIADLDLDALAINLCLRLLGSGGWEVRGIIAADIGWVVASGVLAGLFYSQITLIGLVLIDAIAIAVIFFAVQQIRGLRQLESTA